MIFVTHVKNIKQFLVSFPVKQQNMAEEGRWSARQNSRDEESERTDNEVD